MDFKYNKVSVEGSKWKRACGITIYNEFGKTPHVMFIEEHIADVGGELLQRPAGELTLALDEGTMGEVFPILLPDGSESGRTATVADIAELLTSSYVHFANARDELNLQYEEEQDNSEEEPGEPEEPSEPSEPEEEG